MNLNQLSSDGLEAWANKRRSMLPFFAWPSVPAWSPAATCFRVHSAGVLPCDSSHHSTGGLRYWDDGRDAPDMQMGVIDYEASPRHPRFQFVTRVNFKSSKADEDFGYRFNGSDAQAAEGVLVVIAFF